jgi:hypothetical protein
MKMYWLLASHHLAILAKIYHLQALKYEFNNYVYNENICTTGEIKCYDGITNAAVASVQVSLNYSEKEFSINIYGEGFFIRYNPLEKNTTVITEYTKTYKQLPNELTTGKHRLSFDENNNLRPAIKYFSDLIEGNVESNVQDAVEITRILERNVM